MNNLIRKVLKECIDNFIVSDVILEDNRATKSTKEDIMNKMIDKINSGDEYFLNILDNLGISTDIGDKFDDSSVRNSNYSNIKKNKIADVVSREVIKVINILRGKIDVNGNGIASDVVGDNGVVQFKKLQRYYGPKEYNYIIKMKDMIDELGLSYTYDKSIKKVPGDIRYGIEVTKNKEGEVTDVNLDNFDLNNITDKHFSTWKNGSNVRKSLSASEAMRRIKKGIVDKYVRARYGMKLEIDGGTFSLGNKKLPKETLIVNFTSAYRCPAWNECLVKHACYARSGEFAHGNAKDANDTRSAMWEAGHNDPELLDLMFKLVRTYIVDYVKVASRLKSEGIISNKTKVTEYCKELADKKFSELDEETINIIKEVKKATDIRLNENGDFIGQWLIDAWDENASDLKVVDVVTTAYTCRNLHFDKIKNIIINASRDTMKGNLARYFYCVSDDVYTAFGDTYGGIDNSLDVDENGKITINPQPLFDSKTNQPTDNVYYKCPCGRTDLAKKGIDEVSCYQCRMCYQPKMNLKGDGKCFVLVSVHGANVDEMKSKIPTFGVSKEFNERFAPVKNESVNKNGKRMVNESLEDKQSMSKALRIITNNAINSVNKHLGNINGGNNI